MNIRPEQPSDYREVENLVRESFWNVYRPGALEHYVLHRLRDDPAFVRELDFVMEKDGRIVGQNVFVRTTPSSSARSCGPATLTVSAANTRRRTATSSARRSRTPSPPSTRSFPKRRNNAFPVSFSIPDQ